MQFTTKMVKKYFYKLKAFTLAETLITLSIIGVVAALTVPNLKNSIDEHIYRGSMIKNYAILKNAHALSKQNDEDFYAEPIANSVMSQHYWDNPDLLKNYFKIAKGPFKSTGGGGHIYALFQPFYNEKSKTVIKWLNGEQTDWWLNSSVLAFQLDDGAIIAFHITHCHSVSVFIDANGAKKPNTIGKDIYLFNYTVGAHFNMGSPIQNNAGMFNQILPQGTLGTQSCGGNLYWSEPASDCTKKGKGTTCARDILRNRNFKIK